MQNLVVAIQALEHCKHLKYKSLSAINNHFYHLLDSLVVECWHRVQAVPGSIPNQGPRHTKDVIKVVPVVPLFSTQNYKGRYWRFLKN